MIHKSKDRHVVDDKICMYIVSIDLITMSVPVLNIIKVNKHQRETKEGTVNTNYICNGEWVCDEVGGCICIQ